MEIKKLASKLQKLVKIVNRRNLERKKMLRKIEIFAGKEEEVVEMAEKLS